MIRFLLAFLITIAFSHRVAGAATGTPTADEIVKKAVTRTQTAHAKKYPLKIAYQKLAVTEQLNGKGRVTEREEKLYAVTIQSNRVILRLQKLNGDEPSDAVRKKENQEIADASRHEEPKSPRGEERTIYLTEEMVKKYDFLLTKQTVLRGRPTHELTFRPKKGLTSRSLMDRFMNQIAGTIWIDAVDYEIARADVRLISPVTLWGGVLGAMKRFSYRLDRVRLADDFWFNVVSDGDVELRKLFNSDHLRTHSEWSKARVETK